MTVKSHAFRELPLLGSNQDSPDPESVVSGSFRGDSAGFGGRSAPEAPSSPHDSPHGLPHAIHHGVDWWEEIREAFGYRCAYCGTKPNLLVREHLIPKARGGDDSIENLVPACSKCNTQKSYRTPLEWFLVRDAMAALRGKPAPKYIGAEPCRCGGETVRREVDTYNPLLPIYERCVQCSQIQRQVGTYSPLPLPPSGGEAA